VRSVQRYYFRCLRTGVKACRENEFSKRSDPVAYRLAHLLRLRKARSKRYREPNRPSVCNTLAYTATPTAPDRCALWGVSYAGSATALCTSCHAQYTASVRNGAGQRAEGKSRNTLATRARNALCRLRLCKLKNPLIQTLDSFVYLV
jgi:hypothetical protein